MTKMKTEQQPASRITYNDVYITPVPGWLPWTKRWQVLVRDTRNNRGSYLVGDFRRREDARDKARELLSNLFDPPQ